MKALRSVTILNMLHVLKKSKKNTDKIQSLFKFFFGLNSIIIYIFLQIKFRIKQVTGLEAATIKSKAPKIPNMINCAFF